jgi:F-type H+-transporting ATPase subunit b
MAEASQPGAVAAENEVIAGTTVDGGAAEHAAPAALGMDATMWVALAMLVVIGLAFWKKVPAMITGALDKQIAGVREQLDAATNLRKQAEALKGEYEAKSKAALDNAEAMKAAAQAEAADIVAQAKLDATALIERRTKMAEAKIAAAELAAVADVRARAASLAAAAAEQLIIARHGASADKALVDNAIARLN